MHYAILVVIPKCAPGEVADAVAAAMAPKGYADVVGWIEEFELRAAAVAAAYASTNERR